MASRVNEKITFNKTFYDAMIKYHFLNMFFLLYDSHDIKSEFIYL